MARKENPTGRAVGKSFCYPDNEESKKLFASIEKIQKRENLNFAQLVMKALQEYDENHGDGNECYTMDHFFDKEMLATPAFMRPKSTWQEYLEKQPTDKLREFEEKAHLIQSLISKKMKYGTTFVTER